MTRTRPAAGDDPVAALLRANDPLPDATTRDREVRRATARARAVLADAPVAAHAVYGAPWGPTHLAAGAHGLVAVALREPEPEFIADVERRLGGRVADVADGDVPAAWRETIDRTVAELDEYFAGSRTTFDIPVDLAGLSAWDRAVLGGATRLGYGEVTSYGRLARMIGRPGAARAVGGALGRNPVPIVVPCHRILAGDGTLGGYGGGWTGAREEMLAIKTSLLAREGVRVPAASLVG
jgi:methylated-DNA-[protein]-cysteine S-methyltransferase